MVVNDPDEVIIIEEIHVTNSNKIKVKLFQFHDNYRPAYFGSYRKKSATIRPRRPFAKDEVGSSQFLITYLYFDKSLIKSLHYICRIF